MQDTTPSTGPRQQMPWRQYNLLVHNAGVMATAAAREKNTGAAVGSVDALADYAAGGLPCGPHHLQAPSAGGYTALQKAAALYGQAGAEMPEMGVLFCFAEPKTAYQTARRAEREMLAASSKEQAAVNFVDQFDEAVFSFSCLLPMAELKTALVWLRSELDALRGDGDTGKEGAENPPSPPASGGSTSPAPTLTGS